MSTTPTDTFTVTGPAFDRLTLVYLGLALVSVADTVKVLAVSTSKIQYVVPAVSPPVVVATTKGIPAITLSVFKFSLTVTTSVVPFVAVNVNITALAIFKGRPICFSPYYVWVLATTRRGPHKLLL